MSADAKFKLRFLVLYYMGPISTIHEWDILVIVGISTNMSKYTCMIVETKYVNS